MLLVHFPLLMTKPLPRLLLCSRPGAEPFPLLKRRLQVPLGLPVLGEVREEIPG